MSILLDALAAATDLFHLSVILFCMFAGALPRHAYPKTRRIHSFTLLLICLGQVLLDGRCWVTDLTKWLRACAHPDRPAPEGTFVAEIAASIGIEPVTLLTVATVPFFACMMIGQTLDLKHAKERRNRRLRPPRPEDQS